MCERRSALGSFVQTPAGPRKSGIPESVEMPAPVRAMTWPASRIQPAMVVRSSVAGALTSVAVGLLCPGGGERPTRLLGLAGCRLPAEPPYGEDGGAEPPDGNDQQLVPGEA